MRLRLLFVVNVDWFFLSHRLPIALEAVRRGYEVHIATTLTDGEAQLRAYGFVVHSLQMDRSSTSPWAAVTLFWKLLQLFHMVKPDVVHLVTIKPVLIGGIAARLARVPALVAAVPGLGFVFTAQGMLAALRRLLVMGMYRIALGHTNLRVIFQNNDDYRSLARYVHLSQNKVILVRGSGVDLSAFTPSPESTGRPVVMLAARLLADKGVREFVDAVRHLRQEGGVAVEARFVLVGNVDPANPSSLTQAELDAWANEMLVELWGHRHDMPKTLAQANIVVLPSYREGLPKILIEAAAIGRAVITTDVPGCRDAVKPGQSALVVPAKDSQALASAIRTLLESPARRSAMAAAGRKLAENSFDVRHVVQEHMLIYEELRNSL